ncbi:hypothetical protein EJ04DRAFT_368049 [Polyplosphaeria fusca]|uniref:Uncharacterized protein n=1 Tax=Polyplosphaeria fusca TaxID=682080 RepID=A0A9P4QPU4_9PLEO|nr:hypothetical protein EJ04DRAFT_368049 [Polyplosphaeria fusca]
MARLSTSASMQHQGSDRECAASRLPAETSIRAAFHHNAFASYPHARHDIRASHASVAVTSGYTAVRCPDGVKRHCVDGHFQHHAFPIRSRLETPCRWSGIASGLVYTTPVYKVLLSACEHWF